MQTGRRGFVAAGVGALAAVATRSAAGQWKESGRYPDPPVRAVDQSFNRSRLALATVERLTGGCR